MKDIVLMEPKNICKKGDYMIYTSYFAMLRKLPSNIIPISICAKVPQWYSGLQYKKLAPNYNLLMHWKQNYDENYYIKHFQSEVLDKLQPREVVLDLLTMIGNFKGIDYDPQIVLMCYEKSEDFCHRHLVAKWLNNSGYKTIELKI